MVTLTVKEQLESQVSDLLEQHLVPCESIDFIELIVSKFIQTDNELLDQQNADDILQSVYSIIGIE